MCDIKYRIVYVLKRTNKDDGDDADIYVGGTSQPLWKQLANHRYNAKNHLDDCKNNKLYVRMCEVGITNWQILPLLSRTCSKKEIYKVEKKWVRVLNADLNTYSPIRKEETIEEY